eukprot:6095854-Amphidinium_carterae.1
MSKSGTGGNTGRVSLSTLLFVRSSPRWGGPDYILLTDLAAFTSDSKRLGQYILVARAQRRLPVG